MTEHTPPSASIDHTLVERVKKGDSRAFDLLVLKYQGRVLSVISRFIQDREYAMDVAQETFVKAWRSIEQFRGDSQFYTWLYRIAANTAKNHLAAQGRRPPASDIDAHDAGLMDATGLQSFNSPEAEMAQDQMAAVIEQTINALPETLSAAFKLREFEGLDYEAIAIKLDCPVGTVRSRIFRARETVSSALKEFNGYVINKGVKS